MAQDVAFHFGAPDRLVYVCRLLRKATSSGVRVMVLASPQTLQQLDSALWSLSATDFVTHAYADGHDGVARRSSVVMVDGIPPDASLPPVLLNLADQVPDDIGRFSRVVEVVSNDALDRNLARERWKHYTRMGITITRHDVALKA